MDQPVITERSSQPYVSIRAWVTMQQLSTDLPPLAPELVGWLSQRGIKLVGPLFWKYDVIDMANQLEMEVGAPVDDEVAGDDRVQGGLLPPGRYATVRHVGHPKGLYEVTGDLIGWAEAEGLEWDVSPSPQGERWAARLEIYETNPVEQPDMSKWETVLAFKLAQ